jgi:hypothetical protein
MIAVICRSQIYFDLQHALVEQFQAAGHDVSKAYEIQSQKLYEMIVVIGINEFLDVGSLRAKRLIGVQTEQLPTPSTGVVSSLVVNHKVFRAARGWYDLLVEWHPDMFRHCYRGTKAVFLPYGGNVQRIADGLTKTHDIVFIGEPSSTDDRRRHLLAEIGKRYGIYPAGRWVWGNEKAIAIKRSRICLNLHRSQAPLFESPRFYDYASLGGFILSEPVHDSFPFVEGRDYVTFSSEHELLEKIEYYVVNELERIRIANSGRRVAATYSMAAMSGILVKEAERLLETPGMCRVIRVVRGCMGWPRLLDWRLRQSLRRQLVRLFGEWRHRDSN